MAIAGSLTYDTKLDTKGFESGLGKLKSSTVAIGNLIADAFKSVANTVVDISKKSVMLASDLEEVQNVVDVTFGDDAEKINKWAKEASTAFGMSELNAKKFNGTMGAMLKSMGLTGDEVLEMSTEMTGLAGDFASFYNLDHEEAFNKIRAGISGETEPLKQLGINMSVANLEAFALSQGIDKTYDSMTQAEQATLRYNYLMSVSADAQGDFARTSDSFANQLRILQLNFENFTAGIGEKVLPMLTEVLNIFNGILNGTTSLGDGIEQLSMLIIEKVETLITVLIEKIPEFIPIVINIIMTIVNTILQNLPMILQAGITILLELIKGITQALPDLIPIMVKVIMDMVNILLDNIDEIIECGIELLVALTEGIMNALPELISRLPEIIIKIVSKLIELSPQLLSAALRIILALAEGLIKFIPQLISKIPQIIKSMVSAFKQGVKDFANIGKNLLNGIWEGIKNTKDWLLNKIKGFAKTITNGIKSFFGIHSPSKLFRNEIGKNLILGVGVAFEKDDNLIDKQISDFGDDVYKKMQGAVNMETGKMAFSGTSGSVSQILSSNATFDGNFIVKAEVEEGTLFEANQRITRRKNLQTGFGG